MNLMKAVEDLEKQEYSYRYIANGHIDVTMYIMNDMPFPKGLDNSFTEIKRLRVESCEI